MILVPVGTKAQLIKMAPVLRALDQDGLDYDFVLTGQHRETMTDLIAAFGLRNPQHNLVGPEEANTPRKLLAWLFAVLKCGLRKDSLFANPAYRVCLVHGDTLSTLVCAFLARRHGIPVAHIEAGLRSYNWFHPFPEELTRIAVSKLAEIFYCAGTWACNNVDALRRTRREVVDIRDNTLLDAVRYATELQTPAAADAPIYAIASIHRFENLRTRERLDFIMEQIVIAADYCPIRFVLHPVTRVKLEQTGWMQRLMDTPRVELIPRMDYVRFLGLLSNARFIITDGGSNQEESAYLDLPCLIMRKRTERQEGLNANAVLSDYDATRIRAFLENHSGPRPRTPDLNAAGSPSRRIAQHLKAWLARS
ncbi:MAG: UDP-N-acetylglucosamine 2-epimerase [Gammaproteobacteria bacterium]|nr:UDP-N-acetylglucosamine 2-epimerase [Gammaproteobacteria bacterium]MCP5137707.1 UDP-N-acetylglucosamine 2-epimerase [Gammaproteobacteria bacterium]